MSARPSLDRIDRRILANLQAEARLTNQELSDRVSLSPSACLVRVKRLEKAGFIEGYHARLDPFKLDAGLVLFAQVTLRDHSAESRARFEAGASAVREVVEISHVSGDFDYLLKLVVNDMTQWTGLREMLTGPGFEAERVTTHVVMRKPKIFTGYPVATD